MEWATMVVVPYPGGAKSYIGNPVGPPDKLHRVATGVRDASGVLHAFWFQLVE